MELHNLTYPISCVKTITIVPIYHYKFVFEKKDASLKANVVDGITLVVRDEVANE